MVQTPFYIFESQYDDALMVRMAKGFVEGRWSSSWASTGIVTLTKPVGFPLFLAGAHSLPWSPLVSGYGIYLLGAILIAASWKRLSRSPVQATLVLAAVVLNPIFFANDSQRIYRDICVDDVTTLAVGLAFVIAAMSAGSAKRHRSGAGGRYRYLLILLGIPMGAAAGMVVITKPTWQWLPIALVAPVAYPAFRFVRGAQHRFMAAVLPLLGLLIAVGSCFGVIETTKIMNQRTYGVSLVEDFSTGAFARTWDLWANVEAGQPRRYVPITRAMREAVYKVSPAAAELEPYLESPLDPWKHIECVSVMKICNESATLFDWDMRSAALATGRIHSVRDIQVFFNTVANQIAAACASGSLHCGSSPVLATGLPPLDQIPIGLVASTTADGFWQMTWNQVPIQSPASQKPTSAQYALWSSVVPGMPPIQDVASGANPPALYSTLRVIDVVYGVGNVVLALTLLLGPMSCLIYRCLRRPRSRGRANREAAYLSGLFFVSALIGIGTLAVFSAAQQPGYVLPLYWADFATPMELFLVFGAFAALPVLQGRLQRPHVVAADPGSPDRA